ncbi:MAG: ATP-binding protein [Chloroflexi bacterium]|nr:ATP-binding protein [Chloroflexota bacterium]
MDTLPLGIVVGGSLSKGLTIKLDQATMIEGLAVGRYVVARGQRLDFFSLVTDVRLDNMNPQIEKTPPDVSDPFLARIFAGTATFGTLEIAPMLTLDQRSPDAEPHPVKTVPPHFTAVYNADEDDVARIFGQAEDPNRQNYYIGDPLDMEGVHVHLNLARVVERSTGIFGKSGTGKTFLTRLLLAGIIQHGAAVNLVFDMHNEYGWKGSSEGPGGEVKGLKQLFPSRVSIFTLDDDSSRRRGAHPDHVVELAYDQLEPDDIKMLAGVLSLSEVQVNALYILQRKLGRDWIAKLLSDEMPPELEDFVDQQGLHAGTLGAIRRKLDVLRRFDFLRENVADRAVDRLLEYLDRDIHVVLEFGRYGNSLTAYLLVANYLTRRIHERYVRKKEAALGDDAKEPKPLVITIEEAHKFLDPQIARETIFGTIARELRKYNVTLQIVDQRPSGIDPEVMSQLGTRITYLLDDEADIRAVLTGVSGASQLRQVLARLDSRQQVLMMGHAVPMPVVVQTRTYGTPEFYAEFAALEAGDGQETLEKNVSLLRGEESGDDFFG